MSRKQYCSDCSYLKSSTVDRVQRTVLLTPLVATELLAVLLSGGQCCYLESSIVNAVGNDIVQLSGEQCCYLENSTVNAVGNDIVLLSGEQYC